MSLVALAIACLPSVASAEPVAVDLRNGERVEGELLELLPNERVTLILPNGSRSRLLWSAVVFVYAGPYVYDAEGHRGVRPESSTPPPAVGAPAEDAAVCGREGCMVAVGTPFGRFNSFGAYLAARRIRPGRYGSLPLGSPSLLHASLPSPGGTAMLGLSGGIVLSGGIAMLGIGSAWVAFIGGSMLGSSFIPITAGSLMISRAVHRAHVRREGIHFLEMNLYLGADLGPAHRASGVTAFVPRLAFAF